MVVGMLKVDRVQSATANLVGVLLSGFMGVRAVVNIVLLLR